MVESNLYMTIFFNLTPIIDNLSFLDPKQKWEKALGLFTVSHKFRASISARAKLVLLVVLNEGGIVLKLFSKLCQKF